jgi:hypothetical protein
LSKFIFTPASTSVTAGIATSALTITAEDAYNNPVNVGSSTTLTLTDNSAGGQFSLDGSTGWAYPGSAVINSGTSNVSVYYRNNTPGTKTLTAHNGSYTDATASVTVNQAVTNSFYFATAPASGAAGGASTVFTVGAKDASGNVIASPASTNIYLYSSGSGGTFSATSGGSYTPALPISISSGSPTASFYYKNNTAAAYTLTASDSTPTADGSTGIIDATSNYTVNSTTLSKFIFTPASTSVTAGIATSALTITAEDAYNNPVNVGSSTTLALSDGGSGGQFSLSSSSWSAITAATINSGSSTVTVYYKNNTAGNYTLTAHNGLYTDATTSATVTASTISKLAFSVVPTSGKVGLSSTVYTVQTQDLYGNVVSPVSDLPVYLYSSSGTGAFATGTGGPWTVTSVTISASTNTANFFYKNTVAGSSTITASDQTPTHTPDTGLTDASSSYNSLAPSITGFSSPSCACGNIAGGDAVVISGTNFDSTTTVTIGGTAATVTGFTSTSLSVTTPAHAAGAVNVTATNTGGGTATSANGFTYYTNITWTGTTGASWATASNWNPAKVPASTDDVVINGTSGNMPQLDLSSSSITVKSLSIGSSVASTLTTSGGTVANGHILNITGGLTVGAHGTLTHETNDSAFDSSLVINAGGNITIASGGVVDVSGRGYSVGHGPGVGAANITGTGGGGYGGAGDCSRLNSGGQFQCDSAAPGGSTYGSATQPTDIGSGAGYVNFGSHGHGGGAVKLVSGDTIYVNGSISANGDAGFGGGSGGSIWLSAQAVTGNGSISAKGGDNMGQNGVSIGGAGGGGRIAVTFAAKALPTISGVAPSGGYIAGGDSVTITGSNFGVNASPSVYFGRNQATITQDTESSLTVIAPAASVAGTVNVDVANGDIYSGTVTAAGGTTINQYDGDNGTITPSGVDGLIGNVNLVSGSYTYLQAPAVTSISPSSGAVEGGTSVTVNGSNFDDTTSLKIGGTTATITGHTATTLMATTPAHSTAGPVDVVVSNGGIINATLTGGYTYTPSRLIFANSALNQSALQPGQMNVRIANALGNAITTTADITLNLSSTSGGGSFSLSDATWTPITTVVVHSGNSSASFYYKDNNSGTPQVTASLGSVTISQNETITTKYHLQMTDLASSVAAGTPSTVTLKTVDYAGNPLTDYTGTVHFSTADTFAAIPANFTFTSGMNGNHSFVNGVTFGTTGSWRLTATDVSNSAITTYQDVTATTPAVGTIAKLSVITSQQSIQRNVATSAITVQTQDVNGTPVAVGSIKTIYVFRSNTTGSFSLNGTSGWTNPGSATSSFAITIPSGSSSANVYYKDTANGDPTIYFQDDSAYGTDAGWTNTSQTVNIGVGVPNSLTASVASQVTAGNFTSVTIQLLDGAGNPVTAASNLPIYLTSDDSNGQFSLSSDGSSPAASLATTISTGNSQKTVYFGGTLPTLANITASDATPADGATGLIDGNASTTVVSDTPVSFALTGDATMTAGGRGSITLTLYDLYGNVATAPSGGIAANLSGSATGSAFYAAASGGSAITTRTVISGNPSVTFYYYTATAGVSHLTATHSGYTNATKDISVNAATLSGFQFSPATANASVGEAVMLTASTLDTYGNSVNLGSSLNLTLSDGGAGGSFSLSSSSWSPVTQLTISSGQHSAQVYYRNTTPGAKNIIGSNGSYSSATATVTVSTGSLYSFNYTAAPGSGSVNAPSTVFTVQARDAYGNVVTAGSDTTVYLYSTSGSGSFAASGSGPWTATSVTISSGSSAASFYYQDSAPGTYSITASDQATNPVSDTGIVDATATYSVVGTPTPSPSLAPTPSPS